MYINIYVWHIEFCLEIYTIVTTNLNNKILTRCPLHNGLYIQIILYSISHVKVEEKNFYSFKSRIKIKCKNLYIYDIKYKETEAEGGRILKGRGN